MFGRERVEDEVQIKMADGVEFESLLPRGEDEKIVRTILPGIHLR